MTSLKFKNGSFKIMQIADIQETRTPNPDTIRLLELALEKEKPDLVVFTGDQIQGYSATFLGNLYDNVKECVTAFLQPLIKRNIPFTFTFGNHDNQGGLGKNEQFEIYSSFSNFVETDLRNPDDIGSCCIRIKDSNNEKDALAVYVIDSNAKESDGSYSPVKKEQIEWYKSVRDSISENGKCVDSIVFQHIPVPEFYKIINKVRPFTKGSIEDYKNYKRCFFALDKEMYERGDFFGETPAVPKVNTGEFAAFKEKKDVFALFVGHDHNNSFYKEYEGITLGYTQGTGFNTYGPGDKRGVRVLTFKESDVRSFETYTVQMKDLCDFRPSSPVKHFILSSFPSSKAEAIAKGLRVLAAVGVGAAAIGFLNAKCRTADKA